LFHFLLAFQRHQFHCNPRLEHKVMIKKLKCEKSKFESNLVLGRVKDSTQK
jgi:hypothetical protein